MKQKNIARIALVLILGLLGTFALCSAQPYTWNGTLTYEDEISPYSLNKEWVQLDNGDIITGYWAGDTFWEEGTVTNYQFYADGYILNSCDTFDQWWPLAYTAYETGDIDLIPYRDTFISPKGSPPSLFGLVIEPLPNDPKIELMTKLHKTSTVAKLSALPMFFFAGYAGGMGEGYLSRDGNWDTRSDRSHLWRDISIYTSGAAFALNGYALGVDLFALKNFKIGEWLALSASGLGIHFIGTRVGYNQALHKE